MNRVFAAKLPDGSTGLSEGGEGQGLSLLRCPARPAPSPRHVNPPRGPVTSPDEPLVASSHRPPRTVASAAPDAQSEGFLQQPRPQGRPRRRRGRYHRQRAAPTPAVAPAKPKVIEAKRHEPQHPDAAAKVAATPKAETKQAAARPPLKPSLSDSAGTPAAAAKDDTVAGSQPIVPANSFESRFSATQVRPPSARRTRFPI